MSATSEISTDLKAQAVKDISAALRPLLADVFALYMKTKNFHWHMRGRHFRDYHLLLDEQADQIFAMSDEVAERARKLGGTTLRSISDIAKHQRLKDNNADVVAPTDMLTELKNDNQQLVRVGDHHPLGWVGVVGGAPQHRSPRPSPHDAGQGVGSPG